MLIGNLSDFHLYSRLKWQVFFGKGKYLLEFVFLQMLVSKKNLVVFFHLCKIYTKKKKL